MVIYSYTVYEFVLSALLLWWAAAEFPLKSYIEFSAVQQGEMFQCFHQTS